MSMGKAVLVFLLLAAPAMLHAQNAEQDASRGRMGAPPPALDDSQRQAQKVFREMLLAAGHGDVKGYLDLLSDEDQRRMQQVRDNLDLPDVSRKLTNDWQEKYGRSFEESVAELPLAVRPAGSDRATARLATSEGEMTFQLVRGGWFGGSWRVDVPTSVDANALNTSLSDALNAVQIGSFSEDPKQAAMQVAFRLLKPVSSSTSTMSRDERE